MLCVCVHVRVIFVRAYVLLYIEVSVSAALLSRLLVSALRCGARVRALAHVRSETWGVIRYTIQDILIPVHVACNLCSNCEQYLADALFAYMDIYVYMNYTRMSCVWCYMLRNLLWCPRTMPNISYGNENTHRPTEILLRLVIRPILYRFVVRTLRC